MINIMTIIETYMIIKKYHGKMMTMITPMIIMIITTTPLPKVMVTPMLMSSAITKSTSMITKILTIMTLMILVQMILVTVIMRE